MESLVCKCSSIYACVFSIPDAKIHPSTPDKQYLSSPLVAEFIHHARNKYFVRRGVDKEVQG